ncbi:MAG: holo-ACP synthase [Acidimicrobiales bacterium]
MTEHSRVLVGVDLVRIDDVAEAVEHFGERYIDRIFTGHEQACCPASQPTRAAGLAARFAAKEATIKVLRPDGFQPSWTSIEVHRADAGWCEIHLTDGAAALAAARGITSLSVSLTHEAGMAAAVVVGLCEGR